MTDDLVLIVEDIRVMAKLLESTISDLGAVITAESGAEALKVAADKQPSLILLDVVLPDIDGFEICRRLKANEATKHIPIIIITGLHTETEDETSAFALGAVDYIRKPFERSIVRARVKTQLELVRGRRELEAANKELAYLAAVDPLTKCFNRRYFMNAAEGEIARMKRHSTELTVAIIDIDRFKMVNDRFGHEAGDRALATVAEICEHSLRREDTLGRLGGEEFGILLPATDQQGANEVLQRLKSRISHQVSLVEGESVSLTVSIGMTDVSEDDDSFDQALRRADKALYTAKKLGRNRIVYEPSVPAELPPSTFPMHDPREIDFG
ncbi:diguanylate cyclase [Kordiimonas gwangyangensis]|uniref:diguanylate cyclase n=1 Tax=Kordiimonas gwangyangensis TaxID=288022 RepID=UPI000382325B|nr:diguanylate cyclase [Kordiimonas gwangyangensis]